MPRRLITAYDYLCPFARNASEAVVGALRGGADWDVRFVPFSLSQAHVDEGDPPVWDRPLGARGASGVLAHSWGLAVRELHPHVFLDYHLASFAARHDDGLDINDPEVLTGVATSVGLEPAEIAREVESGRPLKQLAEEHSELVDRWQVFGVPTFIEGDEAVFVRLMRRGSLTAVRRVVDLLGWTELNEFKRTRVPQ